MPLPIIRPLWPLALLALCAPALAAPQHYQCSTVMRYEPVPECKGGVPPAQDEAELVIDSEHKTWSSGQFSGALEGEGDKLTLRQWGAREGRDASFDRASGAFDYRFHSGCLAQHQSGSCKPVP
jgi:hypothetical protein